MKVFHFSETGWIRRFQKTRFFRFPLFQFAIVVVISSIVVIIGLVITISVSIIIASTFAMSICISIMKLLEKPGKINASAFVSMFAFVFVFVH